MKSFLRKLLSSKIVCLSLLIIEFLAIAVIWSLVEFDFIGYITGEAEPTDISSKNVIFLLVFSALRVVLYAIDIIVFFKIILRDENPEYKIPWLVCIFIFPVWTITFYIIFARVKLRKKDALIVKQTGEILRGYRAENEKENAEILDSIDPRYQGVFKYLHNSTNLNVTKGNRITYFKNGEEFFPDMIEALKKAEKFIFIEFFIIGDGVWWQKAFEVLKEKAAAGVEVRIIYDDIGSSKVVPKILKSSSLKKKYGIRCHIFHPVMPNLSNVVNNRDHRKIVVVDHKYAYTGGMNYADEYANEVKRFGYWKDSMVRIEGKGIADLISIFLQNYDLSNFMMTNYDRFVKGDYPVFDDGGCAFSFGDAPGGYDEFEPLGEQNYINMLNAAKEKVYISTPYLITSYNLERALFSAVKRGVEVALIVPGIPDKDFAYWMAQSQFHSFISAGVRLYTYTPGFNHEKSMLVDDRLCFVGTINFDFRSLTHHFECGMTFIDTPCIPLIKADFEEMIAASKEVPADFKVTGSHKIIASVLKIFRVLF